MSGSEQGGAGRREVAYRLFAAEYDDADFSYSESDEERAPNYVVTPTGARVNRLFAVGVLTEVEQVNEDVLRGRIVDPTGAFVVYAGQYQPDEMAFLERADPPMFVSVTGKARTFQPEDSDTVYTSVRPESLNEVDAETRDRWTVSTAERTLDRIATLAGALAREERGDELRTALVASGVDEGLASGTAMAIEHYETTPTYLQALQTTALDAARVVAGERDEVSSLSVSPNATGSATLSDIVDLASISEPASADPPTVDQSPSAATMSGGRTESSDSAPSEDSAETEPATTAPAETATDPDDVSGTVSGTVEPDATDDVEPAVESTPDATSTATESESTTEDEPVATESESMDSSATETDADDDIGDFEPGEFEIEDDERERIEEEFGTDFSTGTEVDDPGEADIETPEPEPESGASEAEPAADTQPEVETDTVADAETEQESADDVDTEPEPAPTDEAEEDADEQPDEDVDLTDAVMAAMRELNDDDGAAREEVVASVVDQYGADPGEVEDAIQDALMDGQCYEPDDATLKPI
ncbi:MAG: hypothetical protein ABEI77_06635 [Halorientalis sp.]